MACNIVANFFLYTYVYSNSINLHQDLEEEEKKPTISTLIMPFVQFVVYAGSIINFRVCVFAFFYFNLPLLK
jgi:hypothetical protein